ncbi:MAG TPA: metallophosphoesterase [Planctomycetia bacterium]|nr:metallophosphoesterase [Planctomycetia bacterium]
MPRILHLSDLHFGPGHRPEVAAEILRQVADWRPDLVVISGDFTLRAKRAQFLAAKSFLAALAPLPWVGVPGNHDVPLYRFWERIAAPTGQYRRQLGEPGESFGEIGGIEVLRLNTTSPLLRLVEGRWRGRPALLEFPAKRPGALRIAVAHHPAESSAAGLLAARRLADAGFDALLVGHRHRAEQLNLGERIGAGRSLWQFQAGTATSHRGRGAEKGLNSLQLLDFGPTEITATVFRYSPQDVAFIEFAKTTHSRVT